MKKETNIKKLKPKTDFLQMFANVYYVIQFMLVHCLFFGFIFEPIKFIPIAVKSFNLEEIYIALVNYKNVFIGGFSFSSIIIMFIFFIPYTVILFWSLRYVLVYLFVFIQLVEFIRIKFKQIKHEKKISLDNVVVVKIGAPGSGKSSSGLYEALVMSRKMWQTLIIKHYIMRDKVKSWRKDPLRNAVKLAEWNEIKFSYNYFKKSNCVPCLMTNIPISVDGIKTSKVKKKHIEQKARLPAYTVLFLDEVGAMLSVDTAKERMGESEEARLALAVSDFFRLIRHFINGRCICTEQDSENIYIDVRRVVSYNEYMLSQKWVLKPYLFLALVYPLKVFIIHTERFSRILAPPYKFLQKLISYIGFRKYRYLRENNTERATGQETGKKTFYLNSHLPFAYDDRTFRNLYNCKDDVCEPEIFKSMQVETDEDTLETFKRERKKKIKTTSWLDQLD